MKLTGKQLQQRATEVYGPHAKVVKRASFFHREHEWLLIVGGVRFTIRNSREELLEYIDADAPRMMLKRMRGA